MYKPETILKLSTPKRQLFQAKQLSTLQSFLFSNKSHESVVNPNAKSKSPTTVTPTNENKSTLGKKAAPAPKAKASQAINSQATSNLTAATSSTNDEMSSYFQANYFASFLESLISKAVCLSGALIAKKEPFEHIAELRKCVS